MLTIVGGGPGLPGDLTQSAIAALERAQIIFVDPAVRDVTSGREDWVIKMQLGSLPDRLDITGAGYEAAWIVPGTPALYPPVGQWLANLQPEDLQNIRVVAGVAVATAALDSAGCFLPEHRLVCQDGMGRSLLSWQDGAWQGDWGGHIVPWASALPLSGRQVVLLRAGRRTTWVAQWLEDRGATVDVCPVSRLTEPERWDAVDSAIRRVNRYDWVLFTSVEGVGRWFARMRHLEADVRHMRAKIAVVGPETALAVRERGFVPAVMPPADYSQEGLAQALQEVSLRGAVMLFPGGQLNRKFLADYLRGRGALVDEVVLYENQPLPLSLSLHQAIRTESPHAILITASSQVEYLVTQLPSDDRRHLANIPLFSIGPLTTRTLRHYGLEPCAEASEPSLSLLAELVRQYYAQASVDR